MVDILDYIPVGHKNAVTRNYLVGIYMEKYHLGKEKADRKMRNDIGTCRAQGHLVFNLQDGKGYFQPAPGEKHLAERYLAQEQHRVKSRDKEFKGIRKYIKREGNEVERNQINLSELPGWNGR